MVMNQFFLEDLMDIVERRNNYFSDSSLIDKDWRGLCEHLKIAARKGYTHLVVKDVNVRCVDMMERQKVIVTTSDQGIEFSGWDNSKEDKKLVIENVKEGIFN